MNLDERAAVVLGWKKLCVMWVRISPGSLAGKALNAAPVYSADWALAEEMLAWLREQCYLSINVDQNSMTFITARRRYATGFMACENGATFPEALAKIVVCVEEALRTGDEAIYREDK